jgi:hypothetical protein
MNSDMSRRPSPSVPAPNDRLKTTTDPFWRLLGPVLQTASPGPAAKGILALAVCIQAAWIVALIAMVVAR